MSDVNSGLAAPDIVRFPAATPSIARIAAVMAELAAASSLPGLVDAACPHVREAVQAAVCTLHLREGDDLTLVGQDGVAADKALRWSALSIMDDNPASEAVRTGRPVVAATPDEVAARYPGMVVDTPPDRSVVDLPLRAADEVVGVLGLTFEGNWRPGTVELEFLLILADACAQAIRRVQATEQATLSTSRLEFLARASAELGSSLDYRATLASVARLSVPKLADWCAVDLLVDEQLTTLAVEHVDPTKIAWAWQLRKSYPIDMSAPSGAPNVVRTGVGELFCDITDEMLAASASDERQLRLARELQLRSLIVVPLVARDRTLGTITLIRSTGSPNFDQLDLTVAEDLGRRAGVAIDNARLFDETANIAMVLQRAVLPDTLGALAGWQTEAYYRPDGRADVGGDFYDAVALPDGRLAVFVGDVMGHGVQAAAAMAHIRSSIRAFLTIDPEPEDVLGNLDLLFDRLHVGSLVSVVYAVVEPAGRVRVANAGSCPPLHVRASSAVELLPGAGRPPLGAGAAHTPIAELVLDPGDTLLLYTDGLIERRGESLTIGLDRLARHGSEVAAQPLDVALPRLVGAVAPADAKDDIAVLALRRCNEVVDHG